MINSAFSVKNHFVADIGETGRVSISDFLHSAGYTVGINSLLGRGFALTLIDIQCQEKIEPPPTGKWRLEDLETGETKEITINKETITHYQNRQKEFGEYLQSYCTEQGVGYIRTHRFGFRIFYHT